MADSVQGELKLGQDQDDEDLNLPDGWCLTTVEEVAWVNPPGKTVSPSDETIVSFLPMPAVEELSGEIDLSDQRPFGSVKKGFTRFREGDLLFAKITPSMENGKIAVARGLKNGIGCGTTEFHVLRPSEAVVVDYLRYFVLRDAYRGEAKRHMAGAVGQQRVPKSFIANTELLLAPLAEQRRIVSRIQELFSKIEAGERAIEQARKDLKRYRKAVLKAAVTGALTEDWRATHPPTETGEVLLARILEERREAWKAAEIEKQRAKKRKRPIDESQLRDLCRRYKGPSIPVDDFELDVPAEWAVASVEQLTSAVRPIAYGVLQPGEHIDGGTRLVRVCDIHGGKVDEDAIKRIAPQIAAQYSRTWLSGGEVLLTLVGTIGRTALVSDALSGANVARAVGVLVPNVGVEGRWLELALREERSKQNLTMSSREVARKTLNVEQVRSFPIPLPPLAEQAEIVSRVEEVLSRADAAEAALDEQARAAQALRQSILKAAFTGRLVPQDPNDEPASELLNRVKESTK